MPPQKELTREQRILMGCRGYQPALHEVLFDGKHCMLIRSLDRMDAAVIYKEGSPEYEEQIRQY